MLENKTLNVKNIADAQTKVNDIEVFGNGDTWQLLCKASSKSQGWMKSTKAMEIPKVGCLVQVTSQQKNPDGTNAIAEAVTFVPYSYIQPELDAEDKVVGRKLVCQSE